MLTQSLKRDAIFNILGNGLPLLVATFTIPYLLAQLGNEGFGLLTLLWALIGYVGFFDLGVGRAMTYEVSRAPGTGKEAISKAIQAGVAITILTGICGSVIVLALVFFGGNWVKVSSSFQHEVKSVFCITSLAIIPTTVTSGLRGALEGFGRFFESNITRVVFGSLMFLLPAMSIALGFHKLSSIAWFLVSARFFVLVYAVFQLRFYLIKKVKVSLSDLKPFISYGGWVSVSGIISPLMAFGDRFFVSMILGVSVLPVYAIPQEGLGRLLLIPTALTGALMPRMSQEKSIESLKSLYKHYFRKISLIMFAICSLTALMSYPVLKIWISPSFATQTALIVPIICLGIWVNSLAQLPATLLHSVGKPRITAILHIIELVVYCGLILFFIKLFGIVGAAIAWSTRIILDFVLLHRMTFRHFVLMRRETR